MALPCKKPSQSRKKNMRSIFYPLDSGFFIAEAEICFMFYFSAFYCAKIYILFFMLYIYIYIMTNYKDYYYKYKALKYYLKNNSIEIKGGVNTQIKEKVIEILKSVVDQLNEQVSQLEEKILKLNPSHNEGQWAKAQFLSDKIYNIKNFSGRINNVLSKLKMERTYINNIYIKLQRKSLQSILTDLENNKKITEDFFSRYDSSNFNLEMKDKIVKQLKEVEEILKTLTENNGNN